MSQPVLQPVTDLNPVGASLRWSEGQVRSLALVTPALRRAAVRMLAAIGWRWDTHDRRHPDAWLALLVAFLSGEIDDLTRAMAAGDLTLEGWQESVAELVRAGYVAAAILGSGRAYLPLLDQILSGGGTASELATREGERLRALAEAHAFGELRFSLGRLERFARTLEAGITLTTTEAQAVARGRLYANYAKVPFWLSRDDERRDVGMTQCANVLHHAKEHCSECLEITRRGWVAIGSIVVPGRRKCAALCGCHLNYR